MSPEPVSTDNRRILSGMRSTNPRLHIGNYEGALRNWVDLQDQGYEMFCMVADLHALTTMYEDARAVSHNAREVAKDFVAAGIDPERSLVFIQSHVPEHSELATLLNMLTPLGWLERVPTYKEKRLDALGSNHFARLIVDFSSQIHSILEEYSNLKEYIARRKLIVRYASMFDIEVQGPSINDANRDVTKEGIKSRIVKLEELKRSLVNDTWFAILFDTLSINLRDQTDSGDLKQGYLMAIKIESALRFLSDPMSSWVDGIFTETQIPAIRELSQTDAIENSLQRYLTTAEQIQEGSRQQTSYGLLGYPVLQTADILLYKPYAVPVGRDQAPHLEIGNDIGARFNRLYGREVFPRYRYMIPEDETRAKLPGLDMRKMSKSYDNCIYLSDTEDETAAKVKSAFTTPTKIKKTDPGIPEGCAVCQYLKLYSPNWQEQWQEDVDGVRGCMQNKKECTEAVNEYLRPIRERRAGISDADIEEILRTGAERAREVAAATMAEVRDAMGMY